jgi:energy-coupling factor transporter ATP-binding protein EcfA2
MITSIEIQGLRGIREGRIEGLAPLTILVGPNGCGKSTVLEALGVACAGPSAAEVFKAITFREWLGASGLSYAVGKLGAKVAVQFSEPIKDGITRSADITLACFYSDENPRGPRSADPGPFGLVRVAATSDTGALLGAEEAVANNDGRVIWTAEGYESLIPYAHHCAFVDRPAGAAYRLTAGHFSSALRDALTAIKLSPWYEELFSYLQVLRPSLSSIESIAVGDRDEPHIFERDPKHGRMGYPLAYAGDGFRRSLLLAGAFARAKGGVAALDEPEAFAHPGMFGPLTGLIKRAVADGTQVVLATHSLEFVAATLQAFEDQPDKAAVVGLRMESGVLDPLVIAGPDAHQRVLEFGHDLRL